tara:strand:- start:1035 stop:1727 length:693 start_codon:yes stop_codon:yes gene_type:complete
MNNILCVDTTSEFCSVSLFNGNELVNTVNSKIERSHSKLIISLVEKVIKESKIEISDIDAFSISRGPGSYTGLRIGLSCLKGFCYGLDKPLISLNTLKILAKSATEKIDNKDSYICPMVDARRMEVFTKLYNYSMDEVSGDRALILDNNSFSNYKDKIIYFVGSGSSKFEDISDNINFKFLPDIIPNSIHMGELSFNKFLNNDFEELSTFEPNYIKDFYLIKKKDKWIRS